VAQRPSLNVCSIWYIDEAKIDFKFDPPLVTTHDRFFGGTRPSTICDENGELLFYTNGVSVGIGMSNLCRVAKILIL
jgi:hypothetical protein